MNIISSIWFLTVSIAKILLLLKPTFNLMELMISMKIFRQMVLVFFFRTENKDGIELNHLQNAS